jgi:uncharacterized protein (UPF0333 family)
MRKKAQVSVEYMFIIGLAMTILIPGSMIFFKYSQSSNEGLVATQINRIGKNLIDTADSIYTVGKNSWTTMDTNFPESIFEMYIIEDAQELVIKYNTARGPTEAVFFSDTPIQGEHPRTDDTNIQDITPLFHPGMMHIKVESKGDVVIIGETVVV